MYSKNLRIYHMVLFLLLCSCAASTEKSARNLSARTQLTRSQPPPEGFVNLPSSNNVLNRPNCYKIWQVFKEGTTTKIREQPQEVKRTELPFKIDEPFFHVSSHHVQQVDDGWLLGFDRGEWGGRLLWFSPDGSQRKELFRGNVRGLIRSSTGIFVVTGLQHLGLSQGKIFHLEKGEGGNWDAKLLVDLRGVPHTFTQESTDSLLVVVGNRDRSSQNAFKKFFEEPGGLWQIKTNGKVDSLLISARLTKIQPNSITLSPDGVIYLGLAAQSQNS